MSNYWFSLKYFCQLLIIFLGKDKVVKRILTEYPEILLKEHLFLLLEGFVIANICFLVVWLLGLKKKSFLLKLLLKIYCKSVM